MLPIHDISKLTVEKWNEDREAENIRKSKNWISEEKNQTIKQQFHVTHFSQEETQRKKNHRQDTLKE